jgi:hypothetical protein
VDERRALSWAVTGGTERPAVAVGRVGDGSSTCLRNIRVIGR